MAAAFRLIRRTLLCLLVGVTAFGVSGWLLRPRANWEVYLGHARGAEFVRREGGTNPCHTIWLQLEFKDADEDRTFQIRAFSSRDGSLLTSFDIDKKVRIWERVLPDGRLLIEEMIPNRAGLHDTRFRIIDPDNPLEPLVRTFDGSWKSTLAGSHAWRMKKPSNECEVVELATGQLQHKRSFPRKTEYVSDVSDDGSKVGVLVLEGRHAFEAPVGVEVRELSTGRTVRRWDFPKSERDRFSAGYGLTFVDLLGRIECEWSSAVPGSPPDAVWRFDLTDGAMTKRGHAPTHPPPNDGDGTAVYRCDERNDGAEIWCADSGESDPEVYFLVHRSGDSRGRWTRVPFEVHYQSFLSISRGASTRAFPRFIPGADAIFVRSFDPPIAQLLPAWAGEALPESWSLQRATCRARWYDLTTGAWLDVGGEAPFYRDDLQLDSNAVYFLRHASEGGKRLESWPLPPRDPKPAAAAISVVSATFVWWICAQRFARRKTQSIA